MSPLFLSNHLYHTCPPLSRSEYLEALPNDSHRADQLLASLARPSHPMSKFTWGNMESLSEKRTGLKDDQMHGRLHEFWRRYYRAPYITLAVQADQSLDTLQQWVGDAERSISDRALPGSLTTGQALSASDHWSLHWSLREA